MNIKGESSKQYPHATLHQNFWDPLTVSFSLFFVPRKKKTFSLDVIDNHDDKALLSYSWGGIMWGGFNYCKPLKDILQNENSCHRLNAHLNQRPEA